MDIKRKEHIQNNNQRILLLEKAIQADDVMLDNLKDQGATSFVLAQVDKITRRNENRREEIETLTQRNEDISSGLLDEEIMREMSDAKKKIVSDNELMVAKKNRFREKQKIASDKSKRFYQKTTSADRENRFREKDMQRAYMQYLNIVDTIPAYISKNLEEMPNNKGYIWRGIQCYGKKAEGGNSSSTILFEKQKGGLLIIHDRTPTEYKIFHKKGKDKKVLYSVEKNIRRIPTGFEDE
jgi:hypothetical protein